MDEEKRAYCERMWTEYEPSLRRTCKKRLSSNPDEIDDVVSEVYLAFCKNVDRGVDFYNPRAWLYQTLSNKIKSEYTVINKKKEREVSYDLAFPVISTLRYEVDYLDAMINDNDIDKLKLDVEAQLNDRELQLMDYVLCKKMKLRDVAKALCRTESAIKQRNYRLKDKVSRIVNNVTENYI